MDNSIAKTVKNSHLREKNQECWTWSNLEILSSNNIKSNFESVFRQNDIYLEMYFMYKNFLYTATLIRRFSDKYARLRIPFIF